jgi:hypothetical protein
MKRNWPLPIIVLDTRCNPAHDVGFIPDYLDVDDPRPASEQFNERYVYGGWHPQSGLTHSRHGVLHFPGDPPMMPLAAIPFRTEVIFVYPGAYVAIFQPDGSFEACRMD